MGNIRWCGCLVFKWICAFSDPHPNFKSIGSSGLWVLSRIRILCHPTRTDMLWAGSTRYVQRVYIKAPGYETDVPVDGPGYVRSIIHLEFADPYFIGTQFDFNTPPGCVVLCSTQEPAEFHALDPDSKANTRSGPYQQGRPRCMDRRQQPCTRRFRLLLDALSPVSPPVAKVCVSRHDRRR